MKNFVYVPLEHIESRYTTHMDRDILDYLQQENIPYTTIAAPYKNSKPAPGMFLNAAATIKNKAQQIDQIAGMYEGGYVTDDTVFFFSDLWFPGIEALAYLNYFHKVKPKITGVIHAGSFTDTDFVRDMERWAKNFEDIVFDICDTIYCASYFLKADIIKKRMVNPAKLVVTGLPLDSMLDEYKVEQKQSIVLFNGRICDEKQPHLFKHLQEDLYTSAKFIRTQDMNLPRHDYLKLLARSKVVVSYALQENFGFGIAEAVRLGCVPVVPNKLAYPEFIPDGYRYKTYEESRSMTLAALNDAVLPPSPFLYPHSKDIFKIWFEL